MVDNWNDNDRIYELEADLEADAIKLARRLGWLTRKFKSPQRRSDPDRWFAKHSTIFWVEFKRIGNEPTEGQWIVIGEMRDVGLDVVWLDSYEDFKACLLIRE